MRPKHLFKVRAGGVIVVIDRPAEIGFWGGHRIFLVSEETLYHVAWYVNRIVPKSLSSNRPDMHVAMKSRAAYSEALDNYVSIPFVWFSHQSIPP
jgi:hypothetical protein